MAMAEHNPQAGTVAGKTAGAWSSNTGRGPSFRPEPKGLLR